MRSHILDLILCAICIFTPYCVWGQSKECDKEYQLEITYYNQHILIYEFISNHTLESPYVDSAWITNADTSQIAMVVHEQPRKVVNIDSLVFGKYILHVQVGECVYSQAFDKNHCLVDYNLIVAYCDNRILIYDLALNQTLEPPHVDSAWITNADTSQIVMVVHEQPREEVNISLLDRGYYLLHAQISDCSYTKMFIKRGKGDAQDLMNTPPASPSATKILRDGQMFILLDNKIYNALGTRLQ